LAKSGKKKEKELPLEEFFFILILLHIKPPTKESVI